MWAERRLTVLLVAVVLLICTAAGLYLVFQARAATETISAETESGTRTGSVIAGSSTTASGGGFVQFKTATPTGPNPYNCPAPYPTLRLGAEGVCVQRLQWRLNQIFGAGTFDESGVFGTLTDQKVREFQTSKGLVSDGIVGPLTWQALEPGVIVTPPPPPPPPPSSPIGTVGGAPGYAFPVAPQRRSQNSGIAALSPLPCYTFSSCHRGTAAFDMGRQPGGDTSAGAPIYAITAGSIYNLKVYMGISGCYAFQLRSSLDGFSYWYGHLGAVTVNNGQTVQLGQQVTTIGRRACTANGSLPHLHIDRGCIINGVKQPGGSTDCRDADFIPLMNKIFNGLPS